MLNALDLILLLIFYAIVEGLILTRFMMFTVSNPDQIKECSNNPQLSLAVRTRF